MRWEGHITCSRNDNVAYMQNLFGETEGMNQLGGLFRAVRAIFRRLNMETTRYCWLGLRRRNMAK
jgi:hypothetical protein